tara:strand:+ start:72 stop:500 length:429 start_codon:yes stop_codon:yes gene_type:complete
MPWTFYNASGQQLRSTGTVLATQAEMEAGTALTSFVTPGRTQNHPGVAKAYCKITNAAGAPATGSYNVASGALNGTGDYTMTYTTSFSSVNYTAIAVCAGGDTRVATVTNLATGTCDVFTFNANADESKEVSDAFFVAFGDQ